MSASSRNEGDESKATLVLNVDRSKYEPQLMNDEDQKDVNELLFGDVSSRKPEEIEAWIRQGFVFANTVEESFGLEQKKGGPCGVLASVQAEVIKYMVFRRPELEKENDNDQPGLAAPDSSALYRDYAAPSLPLLPEPSSSSSSASASASASASSSSGGGSGEAAPTTASNRPQTAFDPCVMPSWVSIQDDTEATLLFPPAANRYESLVISLVTILERASLLRGAQAVAKNTSQANKEAENVSDLPPLPFHPASEVTLVFSTAPDVFYTLTVCAAEAVRLLSRNLAILHSDRGVISFVYSLILTRTLKQVCADIDNVGDPLVAAFGHTTQELVNLVITGVACSNVFDNQKSMSLSIDGPATSSLRGVSQQPDVGYLSLHECLNYLEVGHLLKNPKYPIWVVGSETHYTVLFALDPRVGKLSAHEKREAEVKGIFQQLDPQNNGFLTRDTAAILVESLGLDASTVSVLDPDRQGIVLWEAVRAHFCPYPEEAKASAKPAPGARGDGGGGNGGSGDGSQPGSGSGATPATWSCPACTLTNAYALTKCAVCGSNRPAAPPPSAAPAAPAPAAPAPAAPAAPAKDWSCGVCTYWNTGARSRCEICDSAKPAPPPAPAPAPAPADSQGGVSSTSTSTSTSGGGGGKGNGSGNEEQKAPAPVPVARKLPRIGDGQPQSFSLYHINGLGGIVKKKASPTASRTTSLASVPSGGPSDMADTSNTGVSTYPGTATIADSSQSMTEALPSKSPVLQGATYTVSNRSQTAVALETPVVICRCEISLFDVTVNKSLSYAANLREIIGTRWPTAQVDYVGPAPKIT